MTEAERALLENARAFIRAKEHGAKAEPFYRRMVQAVGAIAKAERIVEEAKERA